MAGPNLHHLEVFHAVARLGSFSKASEEMSISQPTVSLQVRDLERYYGAPLFHRQGRGINLTDVGEVVFSHVQQLFQTLAEMRRSVDNLKDSVTGRLVLGTSSTPGEYLAPHLLGRFTSFHPGVEVSLIIGNTASVTAQVSSGEMALGILSRLALDVPKLGCQRRFYVLHHQNRYLSRPQQAFLDLVKDLSQD